MKDKGPTKIQLVSCDLNGTLVHQHTMADMLRVYFPREPERYEEARKAFDRQTAGRMSMAEAFQVAGSFTKGLCLRDALHYAQDEMRFTEGFENFIASLHHEGVFLVLNSTGYSVTTEAIKALCGEARIDEVICNRLRFGWNGDPDRTIDEEILLELVRGYFHGKQGDLAYDEIRATGEVELCIHDEADKPKMLFAVAAKLKVLRREIAHIGDTMGDSEAICEVARQGGLGIAFNYNRELKEFLQSVVSSEDLPGEIAFMGPKNHAPRLDTLLRMLIP